MEYSSELDRQLNVSLLIYSLSDDFREREEYPEEHTSAINRKEQITEWREWYIREYPHTRPADAALKQGQDIDIRVLFMWEKSVGYSILLFLECCFEVDEAICGVDTAALQSIKKWHIPQEMSAFKYLLSDDMFLWWKRELCELSNEIRSKTSNRVALSLRIRGIENAKDKLFDIMNGSGDDETIEERIWIDFNIDFDLPPKLHQGIFGRYKLLQDSVKILVRELEQSESQDLLVIPPSSSDSLIEGLRQRIPRTSASEVQVQEAATERTQPSSDNSGNEFSNISPGSLFTPLPQESLGSVRRHQLLRSLVELATDYFDRAGRLLRARKFMEFFSHQETCVVISSISAVISAGFMGYSIFKTASPTVSQANGFSDPAFSAAISQAILSIISIYFIIVPIMRSKSLGLQYRFWFWGGLIISSSSSICSVGLYSWFPAISNILSWMGTFAQVLTTALLIWCIDKATKAGNIDGTQRHSN